MAIPPPQIDYLYFGTDTLVSYLDDELQQTPCEDARARFYKYRYNTERHTVFSGAKTEKNKCLQVRVKKEFISEVLAQGLPYDARLTRVDVCADFENRSDAQALCVNALNTQIKSKARINKRTGEIIPKGMTFYYGDRKSPIFERVYWKAELKKWRYECEIKPKTRGNTPFHKQIPIKQWLRLNGEIRAKYGEVVAACKLLGRNLKNDVKLQLVSRKRQSELYFILTSPYLTALTRSMAYNDMTEVEKALFATMLKGREICAAPTYEWRMFVK